MEISDNQQDSLGNYLKKIEQFNQSNKDNAYILDTWIYLVKINDLEIAKFNSITLLEKSKDERINALRDLIQYMINLSPLKLDLQSFS